MAIHMNTEDSSACSSPRISFSGDLSEQTQTENREPIEVTRLDKSLLQEEFDFCVTAFPDEEETSPADELFFNGVIIPTQMKAKLDSMNGYARKPLEEEEMTAATTATLVREEKSQSKSFWRFRRSISLNCDQGHKKSSFWSNLPLLLRSKSTGSSSFDHSSDNHATKQSHKTAGSDGSKLLNSSSGARLSFSSHQKPPLRKTCSSNNNDGGSYPVNGLRNGHILNVPAPYIAKGASDLLGFGSLFGNGSKDKRSVKFVR